MNIIFTVCNRNTYANARVLADSVQKFHPESIFYLCWVDSLALPKLPEICRVVRVEDLKIPNWKEMCERYYDFELVNACRPWFAKELMSRVQSSEIITFLAPTTQLLGEITSQFDQDIDLFLTPNISSPITHNKFIDDKRILNVGMFNANAWAMRKSESILQMLDWWSHRTIDRAKFDLCNGMCMDQLWLNFMPVWIEKHQQWNKPVWFYGLSSIPNLKLELMHGVAEVNGEKLLSIDFAGLTTYDPIWSDHVELLKMNGAYQFLFNQYESDLGVYKIEEGNNHPFGIVKKPGKARLLRRKLVKSLANLADMIDQY